ncbi:MAG: hypothetical protein IJ306_05175 [Oscillospiraceae bacterium]|nr:hypothetical protein [Oscillospiraceae bacterium]
MKKIISFFALFSILALVFSSCDAEPAPEKASYNRTSEEYVYWYEEGRNRDWEEDVIYLADMFIQNDPQISGNEFRVLLDEKDNYYYSDELYNEELRNEFIEHINILIPKIDELEDWQITSELRKIVALLEQAHVSVYFSLQNYYPIDFEAIYSEERVDFYSVSASIENEEAVYAKLSAINGVPIDEIINISLEHISSETVYYQYHVLQTLLKCGEFLRDIGITEKETDSAEFSFIKDDGTEITLTLSSIPSGEYGKAEMTDTMLRNKNVLMYKNTSDNFWHEILEDNTLYIRFNSCNDNEYQSFSGFASALKNQISDTPVKKTVLDFRDNMGGTFRNYESFIEMLKGDEFGNIYVLINDGSVSRAVITPALIKQQVEKTIIIGDPAAEGPNGIGYKLDGAYKTPNFGVYFSFGSYYAKFWPDYEYDALMPDITIYQTIEDYKNGVDTVLEAVLAME